MSEQDLFTPQYAETEFDPSSNYVDQLVGEGKKFSDPNSLAFGKLQSDRFIDRLKNENERMRQELNTSQRLEELVTKLGSVQQQSNQSTSSDDNQNSERAPDDRSHNKDLTTDEDIDQKITKRLIEKDNFDKSLKGLRETFGGDYQTKLDAEAKKLGLNDKDVNRLAKTNPDLFLRIFRENNKPQDDMIIPSSSMSPTTMTKPNHTIGGVRTQAYYKELKASDSKKYWSKAIQNQEYQDALKLGESFFNAS